MAESPLQVVSDPDPAGTFTVAGEVIAQIVGLTVLECYGVVGLVIDLYVVVEYGLNLAEVASNVRSRVQYQVEKLTQIPVHSLQIHIQGVKRT
jgi:uncharacterized alkaline shock family protein YloU